MSELGRYINPFTDFGFKRLFGTKANKDLLVDFLNELLVGEEQIKDLTYLNTERLSRRPEDRKAIYDLYCENEQGEKFIVELQNASQFYFKDRSLYYSTFPIQEQAPKGKWNYELKAVYTVGILNFDLKNTIGGSEKFLHRVKLVELETKQVFYSKLTYFYLETAKFTKEADQLETRFDKWLYVLKNLSRLQDVPQALQERIFSKLFEAAEIVNYNSEEMDAYQESLKTMRDNFATAEYVEKAVEEAVEKAVEEAVESTEERTKNETVANLLKLGVLTYEQIAASVAVSVDKIEAVAKRIQD